MPSEDRALRSNERMLNDVTRTYEKSLFSGDAGMCTVFEIVKRLIAKVASEYEANTLIKRMTLPTKQRR